MTKCHTCKAEIVWHRTEATGKAIPLDAEPHPDGNVIVVREGARDVARVLGPIELHLLEEGTTRWMPHHATCPNWPGIGATA